MNTVKNSMYLQMLDLSQVIASMHEGDGPLKEAQTPLNVRLDIKRGREGEKRPVYRLRVTSPYGPLLHDETLAVCQAVGRALESGLPFGSEVVNGGIEIYYL